MKACAPELTGERREATGVRVSEAQPVAVELGLENAIFFGPIGDHLLLELI